MLPAFLCCCPSDSATVVFHAGGRPSYNIQPFWGASLHCISIIDDGFRKQKKRIMLLHNVFGVVALTLQNMKHLLLFAAAFFLAGMNVFAQVPEYRIDVLHGQEAGIVSIRSVDVSVGKDGLVYVSEEVVVRRGDVVRRVIPGRLEDIAVVDSKGRSIPVYEAYPGARMQLLGFFLEESANGEETVWIRYSTRNLTEWSGGTWRILHENYYTARTTILRFHFPYDVQILSIEPKDVYRTKVKPSEIWLFPQEEYLYCEFRYAFPATADAGSGGDYFLLFAGAFLLIVVLVVIVWLALRRRPAADKAAVIEAQASEPEKNGLQNHGSPQGVPDKPKVKASIMNMLDENEARIMRMLEEADGEITQAYIYKSTQIPKTSLSDIIRRLMKRNLIECKKEGRTNWIKAKDWIFE